MGQGASSSGKSSHGDLRAQGHQEVAHTRPWGVRASGPAQQGWATAGARRGHRAGPRKGTGQLGSSGTSVGLHLRAGPLGGWAEVHHAGRVGSELEQGFEAGAMAPGGLSGFSLFPSLIVRSPHVRPSSGLLVGPWGTWERLSAWGWGSHLARFSSLVFSSLSSLISPPHISPPPPVNRPD